MLLSPEITAHGHTEAGGLRFYRLEGRASAEIAWNSSTWESCLLFLINLFSHLFMFHLFIQPFVYISVELWGDDPINFVFLCSAGIRVCLAHPARHWLARCFSLLTLDGTPGPTWPSLLRPGSDAS